MTKRICRLAPVLLLSSSAAFAASPDAPPSPFEFEAHWIGSGNADISTNEGSLQRGLWSVKASTMVPLSERMMFGFGINYSQQDYDWTTRGGAQLPTWDNITKYGTSLSLNYLLNDRWMLMLSAEAQRAYTDTASRSDSLSFGFMTSAMYKHSDSLMVGFGAGYFDDIDESEALPFLMFDWKFADKWTLRTPFDPGLSGGPGIELMFTPVPAWEIAVGGAARNNKFLVGHSKQYAEMEETAGFLRVSWKANHRFKVTTQIGVSTGAELEVKGDRNYELDDQLLYSIGFEFRM